MNTKSNKKNERQQGKRSRIKAMTHAWSPNSGYRNLPKIHQSPSVGFEYQCAEATDLYFSTLRNTDLQHIECKAEQGMRLPSTCLYHFSDVHEDRLRKLLAVSKILIAMTPFNMTQAMMVHAGMKNFKIARVLCDHCLENGITEGRIKRLILGSEYASKMSGEAMDGLNKAIRESWSATFHKKLQLTMQEKRASPKVKKI